MTGSRIQMISQGRRAAFFGAPDLSSADHPWAGYMLEETETPPETVSRHFWDRTTLFLCSGGQGTNHWKHRGIWHEDRVGPGTLFFARAESEIQARWATESWPTLVLQLDNTKLQHTAPDHALAIDKSLETGQVESDGRLATLMQTMCEEVRAGCPSGRLFGESISIALLEYLAGRYATPRLADACEASLSPAQKRRVAAYVRANLTSNICVTELAGLVQMSASHFARVFKASFGMTPYRFVMQERIDAAKDMLGYTKHSASEVAMAFGFSSQSHFVKVFRQFTGVTPKQYKAGI